MDLSIFSCKIVLISNYFIHIYYLHIYFLHLCVAICYTLIDMCC